MTGQGYDLLLPNVFVISNIESTVSPSFCILGHTAVLFGQESVQDGQERGSSLKLKTSLLLIVASLEQIMIPTLVVQYKCCCIKIDLVFTFAFSRG